MFIDINSLKIKKSSDSSYLNLGDVGDLWETQHKRHPLITEARYGYNKIWGKDSGRNLKGEMSGTLIGIFPKIIVTFKKLTKEELELVAPILDAGRQTLQYYDPKNKATRTLTTYTGDWEITNKNIIDGNHKNESFEISFISVSKRS